MQKSWIKWQLKRCYWIFTISRSVITFRRVRKWKILQNESIRILQICRLFMLKNVGSKKKNGNRIVRVRENKGEIIWCWKALFCLVLGQGSEEMKCEETRYMLSLGLAHKHFLHDALASFFFPLPARCEHTGWPWKPLISGASAPIREGREPPNHYVIDTSDK